tara:strand:- start:722 stop:1522 length:801 start_codon:yes stop_codon:yes gene_type:complete
MAFDYLETNHLDVYNSFTGGGLSFPKIFSEPGGGVLSAYKGHFGQGSTSIPYSASLVSAPSVGPIPSPLSWNFLGLGVETGTRNLIGADVKIGSDISLGAISARYSAVFNKITGKEATVAPKDTSVAPAEAHISAKGDLFGNWAFNGLSLALLHTHSDSRLKKKIESIPNSTSLTKVLQLNPVYYEWREDILPSAFVKNHRQGRQIGLIAQEVEEIIPEIVKEEKIYDDEWKGVNYEKLTAVLIGAVKEQQKQIEELKTRITELES